MALNKIVLSDGVTELANVKSVAYKEVVNSWVGLRPGCVGSAQIEVEVYGNQAGAVAAGEVVRYYQIDAGGNETLMGLFTAEPSIETKNSYKFLAYDNAQKLDADFSQWLRAHQEDFPLTVYALVSAACTVAGVTLVTPLYSFAAFFGSVISLGVPILYAQEMGKFNKERADHVFGLGLLLAIVVGILLFILTSLFGTAYLRGYYLSIGRIYISAE